MKIPNVFDLDNDKSLGKIYFMSDIHYNHENAINFGQRPFENVLEMNKYIMETIQNTLKPEDVLFTLGDDFWRMKLPDVSRLIDSFPTKKIYKIMGNHDKYGYYMCGLFNTYFVSFNDFTGLINRMKINLFTSWDIR